MAVITIRGQLGSGAPEIGKLIADRLHIDYVDREIIADVAKNLNRSKESITDKEMPPGTLLGRIAEALGQGFTSGEQSAGIFGGIFSGAYLPTWEMPLYDTHYLTSLDSIVRELAKSEAVVIRGRGSQFILKDHPGAIHVLVVAPLQLRIKRIMKNLKLGEESARKEIDKFDSSRREFTKRYFHAELEDSVHYDLVINTEHLSFSDAAQVVIGALPLKDREPGE